MIPSDCHVLGDADRLYTRREFTVTVNVNKRDKRSRALCKAAFVGSCQRDVEALCLLCRNLRLISDAEEMLRKRDKRISHNIILQILEVEIKVSRHKVYCADALVIKEHIALHRLIVRTYLKDTVRPDGIHRYLPFERGCRDNAIFTVCRPSLPHLLISAGINRLSRLIPFASLNRPAELVVGLCVRYFKRNRIKRIDDPPRRERSVDNAIIVEAEVHITRFCRAWRYIVCGARLVLEIAARISLNDNRSGRAHIHLRAVITQCRMDDGDGIILNFLGACKMRYELLSNRLLVVGIAHFAPCGPTILVGVCIGVITRAVKAVGVFLKVFHEVMVGVDFTKVDIFSFFILNLEEVVDNILAYGMRKRRIKWIAAVALGDYILLII